MQKCILKDFLSKLAEGKEEECWQWYGSHDKDGRAKYLIDKKLTNAARILYELKVEKIPAGKQVLHTCDHSWCMNWHHFFIGYRGNRKQGHQDNTKLTRGIIYRDKLTVAQQTLLIDLVTNSNKPKKEIAAILGIGIDRLNNLIKKHDITSKKKQQEEQILELLQNNETYEEISEIIGTSINVIGRIAHKTGIYRKKRLDRETIENVLELHKEGKTYKEIVETLDITYNNISSIVTGKYYKKVTAGRKLTTGKKLTELGILQIRLWVKEGKKQKEISEIMGISIDTISNIVRGKSWKHVL